MSYIGTGINDSPTITAKAAGELKNAAFLAARFDENGALTTAGDGAAALGLFIVETPETVKAGDSLTVQVKDIGLWKAGAAFKAGDPLASDADGKAVKAAAGKFILGTALEAAAAADKVVRVQICKAGYAPAGA